MVQMRTFYMLARKISKEIHSTVSIQKFSSAGYYKCVTLTTSDPLQQYAKIKSSKAMHSFERLHNAVCVLDKQKDGFVVYVNY